MRKISKGMSVTSNKASRVNRAKLRRVKRMESVIAIPRNQMIVINENKMKQLLEEDSSDNRRKAKERFDRVSKKMIKR